MRTSLSLLGVLIVSLSVVGTPVLAAKPKGERLSAKCSRQWQDYEAFAFGTDPFRALQKVYPKLTESFFNRLKAEDPKAQAVLGLMFSLDLMKKARPKDAQLLESYVAFDDAHLDHLNPRVVEVGLETFQTFRKRLSVPDARNARIVNRMDEQLLRSQWDSGLWSMAYVGAAHVGDYYLAHPEADVAYVNQSFKNRWDPQSQQLFLELIELRFASLEEAVRENIATSRQQQEMARALGTKKAIGLFAQAAQLEASALEMSQTIQTNKKMMTAMAQPTLPNELGLVAMALMDLGKSRDPGLPRLNHFPHRPLLVGDIHHRRNPDLARALPEAECVRQKGIRAIHLGIESMGSIRDGDSVNLTAALEAEIRSGSLGARSSDLEVLRQKHPDLSEKITAAELIETSNFTLFLKKLREYELAGISVQVTSLE